MILQSLSPGGVDWLPCPDTPLCIVIHGGQFTGGVHPQISSTLVSPLPCSPVLVRHTLLIVYFFKEHI